MSCVKCDDAQKVVHGMQNGKGSPGDEQLNLYTFVRVGPANVLISGCELHLQELLTIFRLGLKAERILEKEADE